MFVQKCLWWLFCNLNGFLKSAKILRNFTPYCGEPAISLHSYTVPLVQWSTRHEGPGFNPQGEYSRILLLALSHYLGDPDVIDHCGLVWGGLRPEPSLGRRADNVIIPLDLAQLSCPDFTLAAGPPSGFTTDIVSCWGGGALWRAITMHSYTVPLEQWSTHLLPVMRDLGSIPRGVLMWNWDQPECYKKKRKNTFY